ncbi:hypothetical protein PspS34_09270 [Pseudomonas sp. S34]|nr:hypothetical protein PspS34_09270 [Pseudomonas sp. S34]
MSAVKTMAAVRGALSGAPGYWIPGLPHPCTASTPDFVCSLEGSTRSLALSIQQLAVVGELLVNRALDNVDPQGSGCERSPGAHGS